MSRAVFGMGIAIAGAGLFMGPASAAPRIASPEACAEVKRFMAQGGFRMPAHVSAEDRAVAIQAKRMADRNGSAAADAAGQALLKGMNMDPAAKAVAHTAGRPGATGTDAMGEAMKQLGC